MPRYCSAVYRTSCPTTTVGTYGTVQYYNMATKEANFDLSDEGEEDTAPRRRRVANRLSIQDDAATSSRKSEEKEKSKNKQIHIPKTMEDVQKQEVIVKKKILGSQIDHRTSLAVIHYILRLQKVNIERARNDGAVSSKSHRSWPSIRNEIGYNLGLSRDTMNKIAFNFFNESASFFQSSPRGNRQKGITRLPRTKAMRIKIRDFVREKRRAKELVTAKTVFEFLCEKGMLIIPEGANGICDSHAYSAAYKCTRRLLQDFGYRRGKRNNLVPDPQLIGKRQAYLLKCKENDDKPPEERLRHVFLDESYIHQHHSHDSSTSIFKGNRVCFAAAIQGQNPRAVASAQRKDCAGLVPGSLWSFCPQKVTKDYYSVFNSDSFCKWFREQVVDNLEVPSLIHMDNAEYHKAYPATVPKWSRIKKGDAIVYLRKHGVKVDAVTSTSYVLKRQVKEYIESHEKLEVEKIAEAKGHKVIFIPPYHSDLQPIELVWAYVQGNIAQQYSEETTLEDVESRLSQQFELLEDKGLLIGSHIEYCRRVAAGFLAEIPDEDDAMAELDEIDQEKEENPRYFNHNIEANPDGDAQEDHFQVGSEDDDSLLEIDGNTEAEGRATGSSWKDQDRSH